MLWLRQRILRNYRRSSGWKGSSEDAPLDSRRAEDSWRTAVALVWPASCFGSVLLLIFVPILVIRARRRARSPEGVAQFFSGIEGIRRDRILRAGDVHLVFHTYSGFLAYVTQRTHDLVLPAAEARIVLKRMLRHNLTWGMFAYGFHSDRFVL